MVLKTRVTEERRRQPDITAVRDPAGVGVNCPSSLVFSSRSSKHVLHIVHLIHSGLCHSSRCTAAANVKSPHTTATQAHNTSTRQPLPAPRDWLL